jgi:hypothetical protein
MPKFFPKTTIMGGSRLFGTTCRRRAPNLRWSGCGNPLRVSNLGSPGEIAHGLRFRPPVQQADCGRRGV